MSSNYLIYFFIENSKDLLFLLWKGMRIYSLKINADKLVEKNLISEAITIKHTLFHLYNKIYDINRWTIQIIDSQFSE